MGNQNSSSQSHEAQHTFNNSHLGTVQPCFHPIHHHCLLKVYHFADPMMGQQKLRRFQARIKKYNDSDSVLAVLSAELKEKEEMCGYNSDLYVYFQRFTENLRSVLDRKLKEKQNFTEKEILQFLKRVVTTLIFLQDNGFKNCQLDKDSIFICQDKLKIFDMALACNSPYQNFLDQGKIIDGCYFSPEMLKQLKEKNFQPFLSPKSDVFTLGMLTLELACLQPLDSYYDMQTFSLDYQSLIHRVSRIVYSTQLKTIIAQMLQYEGELRLGLLSLQQKLNKLLNVEEECKNRMKRSRSSSTKMLKQLLTSSRKSSINSQNKNSSQILVRKNSSASFNSMTSINSRNSINKLQIKKQNRSIRKENKEIKQENQMKEPLMPTKQDTNMLKNFVRNKTGSQKTSTSQTITLNISLPSENIRTENKENSSYTSFNKFSYGGTALNDFTRSTSNSRTFFDIPYYQPYQYRDEHLITPKAPQPFFKKKQFKEEQSIFKLIQNDPRYNSNCSQKIPQNKQNSYRKTEGLENSQKDKIENPVNSSPFNLPKVQRVQETNSIKKCSNAGIDVSEVTQFKDHCKVVKVPNFSPSDQKNQSISLRVKNSLDNMYKTTRSINSSEEKSFLTSGRKDVYKRIDLTDGCYYQGEIVGDNVFEGNGILYASNGHVIYNGAWQEGKYDGFGTLYNLNVKKAQINKFDLSSCQDLWVKYEGEFKNGERQGFGTIYFENGERFSGCMKNGQVSGYGCFYDNMNHMTSGIWTGNRLKV